MDIKHINFEPSKLYDKVYLVKNKKTSDILGYIKWHESRKQYIFVPKGNTILNYGCLGSIKNFLSKKNTKQKKRSK